MMSRNAQDSRGATHPDYEEWADLFQHHGAVNHPSEMHGVLTGELAGGGRLLEAAWTALVMDLMGLELEPEELADYRDLIDTTYAQTLQALERSELAFEPMLPEDHYPLDQRVQALAAWVRGFLEGLALTAGPTLAQAEGDMKDLLQDLVAIAQIDEDTGDSEDGERDLMEVAEYVRMAALSLFAEFNRPAAPPATVH